jgi:hypothetical protein
MADEVEMIPVEMTPVAEEPPKANPLARPAVGAAPAPTVSVPAPAPAPRPVSGAALHPEAHSVPTGKGKHRGNGIKPSVTAYPSTGRRRTPTASEFI